MDGGRPRGKAMLPQVSRVALLVPALDLFDMEVGGVAVAACGDDSVSPPQLAVIS